VFGVHRLLNPLNIEPQPSSTALPASPNSPSIIEKPFTEPPLRRIVVGAERFAVAPVACITA
jgi:hypothetical protein